MTELKHAGFHVILIGHLAKKYQTSDSALRDVGLRVLADAAISSRCCCRRQRQLGRAITPIIKPPRPAHLQFS